MSMVPGGFSSYGHLAGILMNDATVPRIPGDPGHAETFSFPVVYEVLKGFPFQDLVEVKMDHLDILVKRSVRLQQKGVKFIAADCGLFGPFNKHLKPHLSIPFIGSALDMIPMLQTHFPKGKKIGIITGDTNILKRVHMEASGVSPESVILSGMETCKEFDRVTINGGQTLAVKKMREGVLNAAKRFNDNDISAIVLECTNLIPFRRDIQEQIKKPVYDLVSLIEFYASGFALTGFSSRFF